MLTITDAFLARYAGQEPDDGTLRVDHGYLRRAQIGPDGTVPVTLVILWRRPLDDPEPELQVVHVDLQYPPPMGRERIHGVDVHPQQDVDRSFAFLDYVLDANIKGEYQFIVRSGHTAVTVPDSVDDAANFEAVTYDSEVIVSITLF